MGYRLSGRHSKLVPGGPRVGRHPGSWTPTLFPARPFVALVALRIHVRATIRPTEDAEKVRKALVSLFPGAPVEIDDEEAIAVAPSLDRLRELIRSQRIPDTARGVMLAGLADDGMSARFLLGKQAAAAGRAHFGPLRSPLGDIEVTLFGEAQFEVERAIFHAAPDTTVPAELAEVPTALRPME